MAQNRTFPAWFNVTTIVVAFVFLVSVSCSGWKSVTKEQVSSGEKDLVGKLVRIHKDAFVAEFRVESVDLPFVRGVNEETGKPAEVDLTDVSSIEVREINGWQTFIVVAVGVTLVVLLFVALTEEDDPPPVTSTGGSGSSCPIVYVDGEKEPVGEAYAGAIFRSIQRDDLMPLPRPNGSEMRLLLANQARETQFTDVAELVSVEHRPGVRVLSANNQSVIPVSSSKAPSRVRDLLGTELTEVLAHDDVVYWQTDANRWVSQTEAPVRDGLEATFAKPGSAARPVLELTLSNTDWLETVVQRFFAMMGGDYASYLVRGNEGTPGPLVQHWIDREGVSLDVEWKNGEAWERVAVVLPIGPAAFRHIAVPLPDAAMASSATDLRVRVTGGSGFWRIDSMAMSTEIDEAIDVQRTTTASALDRAAVDSRDALARADGNYQVLANADDWLRVSFATPPAPAGRERTYFLFTNGYYNLHPPVRGGTASPKVSTIMTGAGNLARFGMDLYKESREFALQQPAIPLTDE